jgi:hypothetical protein
MSFPSFLQDVVKMVQKRQIKPRGFNARFKEVIRSSSTSNEVRGFRNRIRDIRSNFIVCATHFKDGCTRPHSLYQLMTAVDINFQVQKVLTVMAKSRKCCFVWNYPILSAV